MNKKQFFLSVCVLLYSSVFFAQPERKIDSLLKVLKDQKEDTNRVNILNDLSRNNFLAGNDSLSLKFARESIELSQKLNFKKGSILGYTNIGLNYESMGNYDEAMINIRTALKFAEEDKNKKYIGIAYNNIGLIYFDQGISKEAVNYFALGAKLSGEADDKRSEANAYYNLGNIYYSPISNFVEAIKAHTTSLKLSKEIGDKPRMTSRYIDIGNSYESLGNYPEAIKNYLAALKLSEEIGNKGNVASAYNNIGEIYNNQGDYEKAMEFYASGLKVFEEINSKYGICISYDNIGDVYQKKGNYTEAIKYHLLALKLGKEMKYTYGIAYTYRNIGTAYFFQSNYKEALLYYDSSLNLFRRIQENEGLAKINNNIGETYFKTQNYSKSENYLNQALSAAIEMQDKKIIKETYENLARLDSAMNNWKGAYQHQKFAGSYRDSLINEENTNKITEKMLHYEFSKKEDSLKYNQALTDERLKKQKQDKNYLIGGLILFIILSFFVYRYYRIRQKLKMQTLRNKIAIDLHDDVGSTLSSISIFSQIAQEQSKENIPLLETIGESSRKMLDAMADIVWTIKPENDQFEKIILRMRSFAFELLGAKHIDFEFTADEDVEKMKLSMEVRKNLYLIFKEATNNMVKYSDANKAMFSLKGEKNNLTMTIQDNGKGFDTNKSTDGNGLKNMKKRAIEIGANLLIESYPGNGTTIRLNLAV